jgi:hypothetical protein
MTRLWKVKLIGLSLARLPFLHGYPFQQAVNGNVLFLVTNKNIVEIIVAKSKLSLNKDKIIEEERFIIF